MDIQEFWASRPGFAEAMRERDQKPHLPYATEDQVKNYTYRHYGADKYSLKKFRPVTFDWGSKPDGGLWASPEGEPDRVTWRDWCRCEDFGNLKQCFDFRVTATAKILILNYATLAEYGTEKPYICGSGELDWDRIVIEGWDAFYYDHHSAGNALGPYDVDSICVMNPEIVVPIRK